MRQNHNPANRRDQHAGADRPLLSAKQRPVLPRRQPAPDYLVAGGGSLACNTRRTLTPRMAVTSPADSPRARSAAATAGSFLTFSMPTALSPSPPPTPPQPTTPSPPPSTHPPPSTPHP